MLEGVGRVSCLVVVSVLVAACAGVDRTGVVVAPATVARPVAAAASPADDPRMSIDPLDHAAPRLVFGRFTFPAPRGAELESTPDSAVLGVAAPGLHLYVMTSTDPVPDEIQDADFCYGFATGFAGGFLNRNLVPEGLEKRMKLGPIRLRFLAREPHPLTSRGCLVEGDGKWTSEDFARVACTTDVFPAAHFGYVAGFFDAGGGAMFVPVCVFALDDEQAKATCLAVIEGARLQ